MIERQDIELSDERLKLHRLVKENGTRETLKLPDISKFLRLDEFDREMLQILVKRIEVSLEGKVKVSYNFVV